MLAARMLIWKRPEVHVPMLPQALRPVREHTHTAMATPTHALSVLNPKEATGSHGSGHVPAINELELGEKIGRGFGELLAADAARQFWDEGLSFRWRLIIREQAQCVSSKQTLQSLGARSEALQSGRDRVRDVRESITAKTPQLHFPRQVRRQVQLLLEALPAELHHDLAGDVVAWMLLADNRPLHVSECVDANVKPACEPANERVLFVCVDKVMVRDSYAHVIVR
jgi:hypothetical protein